MYNKLSFLPTESHYPVCCHVGLALDDYQDIDPNGSIPHTNDIIDVKDPIKEKYEFNRIIKGEDNRNKTMEEIIDFTKNFSSFNPPVLHGIKIDTDFLPYACRVIAIGDGCDISSIIKGHNIERKQDGEYLTPCEHFLTFTFFKQIPIKLVEESQMPTPPISGDYSMETLGCYYSSVPENSDRPLIFLCPKRIEDAIGKLKINQGLEKISLKVLYAIVLIHELAHAIMDPTNRFDDKGNLIKEVNREIKSEADLFMEESLANMITLKYFAAVGEKINNDDYSIVKEFMKIQPDAYKFGITQYELLHTDWEAWRDNKSTIKFWAEWGAIVQPHIEELKKLKIV